MLKRFKIVSGEFNLIIREEDFESAALSSIRLHRESNHCSYLGTMTMVESSKTVKFFDTQQIIDSLDSFSSGLRGGTKTK